MIDFVFWQKPKLSTMLRYGADGSAIGNISFAICLTGVRTAQSHSHG